MTPNDLARDAMGKAADELDKLATAAETEADLWRQASEHMRRHALVEASDYAHQASKLCDGRSNRAVSKLVDLVSVADPAWYRTVQMSLLMRDLVKLPPDTLRQLWHLHKSVCSESATCLVHEAMITRIRELGL